MLQKLFSFPPSSRQLTLHNIQIYTFFTPRPRSQNRIFQLFQAKNLHLVVNCSHLFFFSHFSFAKISFQILLRSETRKNLAELDEGELFMELIKDVANELDIDVLCHKILVNVGLLTHADRGSLFLVKGNSAQNRCLVAKLFDVTQSTGKGLKKMVQFVCC